MVVVMLSEYQVHRGMYAQKLTIESRGLSEVEMQSRGPLLYLRACERASE